MFGWALRAAGHHAVKHAVTGGRRPIIDIGLGLALLRDGRVPLARKAMALLMGAVAVFVMIGLELPVETMIALLLNIPGVGLDIAIDGLEAVAGPILIGSLFLIRLAPPTLVEQVRAERLGLPAPIR